MPRAMIRNGVLWLCHAVGLNGASGTYTGDATGFQVDRSAAQWFRARADTVNGSLTYLEHGRIYDPATTNPSWYYFPSLAVNCAGDMVAAFSGSSANGYVGAYYSWRPTGGAAVAPRLINLLSDLAPYPADETRWGDYSIVVTDPADPWSFWTVQEYAGLINHPELPFPWKTVIARIKVQQ